jgi:hypothetical protein
LKREKKLYKFTELKNVFLRRFLENPILLTILNECFKLEIDSINQNEEKISSIVNIAETITRIQVNLTLIKDNLIENKQLYNLANFAETLTIIYLI